MKCDGWIGYRCHLGVYQGTHCVDVLKVVRVCVALLPLYGVWVNWSGLYVLLSDISHIAVDVERVPKRVLVVVRM